MRYIEINRDTTETQIEMSLELDGNGDYNINTGVGFFDHMLVLFTKHGFFDLKVNIKGDLHVDAHHTVEDCGIVLGQAVKQALGDKKGISRYGNAFVPMDETLAHVCLDISSRPYIVFNADFPKTKLGNFDLELVEEFFRAFAINAGITLHINVLYGSNTHHMAEAIFKAFARALSEAATLNSFDGVLSTKGIL